MATNSINLGGVRSTSGIRGSGPGAALMLVLSCSWLLICYVLLGILVPTPTAVALLLKILVVVAPLIMLWTLYLAGSGGPKSITSILLLVIVVSELSLRQRQFTDTSVDPQNIVKMAIWAAAMLVALLNWQRLRAGLREPATMLMALTTLWFSLTAIYSPIPAYSFGVGIAFLAVVLFGAVARRSAPAEMLLKSSTTVLAVMLFIGLVLYVVAPERAMAPIEGGKILRLAAPFGTPNSLGRVAATVILLVLVGWRRGRLERTSLLLWIGIPVALACLYLSQSRTATAALFSSLLVVYALERPVRGLVVLIFGATALLLFFLFDVGFSEVAVLFSRSGHVSEVTTLTGRTEIWSVAWNKIIGAPIFGYGNASTKVLIPQFYRTHWGWTSTHAHNMWLQVWFTTGIIGLSLLAATMATQCRYWWRSRDSESLALLVFVFVIGLAEAGHIAGAPSVLTVLWAVWITGPVPRVEPEATAVVVGHERCAPTPLISRTA